MTDLKPKGDNKTLVLAGALVIVAAIAAGVIVLAVLAELGPEAGLAVGVGAVIWVVLSRLAQKDLAARRASNLEGHQYLLPAP